MSYRVVWNRWAEDDLATVWLAAADREAVAAATAWLDDHLARLPLDLGEPWASSVHRIAYYGPVGVEYEVIEDDKRVLVHSVFGPG
ncbi:MAG: hypothetical protein U0871_25485 [Gemmataceae bacterium]